MKRIDDYYKRREHIKNLSDEDLYNRFWSLTEQIVMPMVKLSEENTTPAIERSVLLRMGFSSIEAHDIVKECTKWELLGKGAGNCVLVYSKIINKPYLEAGQMLSKGEGFKEVKEYFESKRKAGDK